MAERARILEITSYPPPRAGWGVRVEFLKKQLESEGHDCVVLNIGRSRSTPSPEYEMVRNGFEYVRKVWRFSRAGYVAHVHVNGTSPKGFLLTLVAEVLNLVSRRRSVLTFHAGIDQPFFPRPRAPLLLPMFWVMFALPRHIICNSQAVKAKIQEYGVPSDKIVPIPAFSRQYLEHTAAALPDQVAEFYERYPQVLLTYIRIRPGFYLDVLLDGFARLATRRSDVGLLFLGVSGDIDRTLWAEVEKRILSHRIQERMCIVDDLDHDQFLTALGRSAIYLRTPTSDGVASSVLEALALGVPVVAAENGTRPPGVVTYRATDEEDMAGVVDRVLRERPAVVASIPPVPIRDTLTDEVRLLTSDI
jgi:glycosyltransferase involved in cell wall biosynthesis